MRRLILRSVTLENFKSYAGRHVVGPFSPGFSCVLGANGSGKSNLIDALLFVLGRRAKQLRHERLADLVHSSAEHPDCASARVTLTFALRDDGAPAQECVPGSEFTVARAVARASGQSHYELGGRRCSLDDVQRLLLSHGVDLRHNRFLILQGEVEQISLMKPRAAEPLLEALADIGRQYARGRLPGLSASRGPGAAEAPVGAPDAPETAGEAPEDRLAALKAALASLDADPGLEAAMAEGAASSETELLELVEGVIGTDSYVPRIARASAALALADEGRAAARARLRAASAQRGEVDDAAADAVRALERAARRTRRAARKAQVLFAGAQGRARRAEERARELEERLQSAQQGQQAALQRDLAAATAEARAAAEARERAAEEYERECVQARKQDAIQQRVLEEKLRAVSEDATAAYARKEELVAELQAKNYDVALLPQAESAASAEIQQIEAEIEARRRELAELDSAPGGPGGLSSSRLAGAQEELRAAQDRLAPVQQQAALAGTRVRAYQEQVCGKLSRVLALQGSAASLGLSLLAKSAALSAGVPEAQRLQQEISRNTAALSSVSSAAARIGELNAETERLENLIRAAERQAAAAEAEGEGERGPQASSRLERELLEAQRRGELRGVRGRAGDLGSVDPSLALAAVAAFGPALDSIVVNTLDDAKAALALVRSRDLGIANLLNLEQVAARHAARASLPRQEPPPGTRRFLDMVAPAEPDLLPVFWHIMGDTLVAESLEVARAASSGRAGRGGRWRVVTLTGELFEASGVITGGGDGRALLGRHRGFGTEAAARGALERRRQAEREAEAARLAELRAQLSRAREEKARMVREAGPAVLTAGQRQAELQASLRDAKQRLRSLLYDLDGLCSQAGQDLRELWRAAQDASLSACGGSLSPGLAAACDAARRLLDANPIAQCSDAERVAAGLREVVAGCEELQRLAAFASEALGVEIPPAGQAHAGHAPAPDAARDPLREAAAALETLRARWDGAARDLSAAAVERGMEECAAAGPADGSPGSALVYAEGGLRKAGRRGGRGRGGRGGAQGAPSGQNEEDGQDGQGAAAQPGGQPAGQPAGQAAPSPVPLALIYALSAPEVSPQVFSFRGDLREAFLDPEMDRLCAQLGAWQAEAAVYSRECTRAQDKLNALLPASLQARKALDEATQRREAKLAEARAARARGRTLQLETEKLQRELAALDKAIVGWEGEHRAARASLDALEARLRRYDEELAPEYEKMIGEYTAAAGEAERRAAALREQCSALLAEMEAARAELEAAQRSGAEDRARAAAYAQQFGARVEELGAIRAALELASVRPEEREARALELEDLCGLVCGDLSEATVQKIESGELGGADEAGGGSGGSEASEGSEEDREGEGENEGDGGADGNEDGDEDGDRGAPESGARRRGRRSTRGPSRRRAASARRATAQKMPADEFEAHVSVLREFRARALTELEREAEFAGFDEVFEERRAGLSRLREARASEFLSGFTRLNAALRETYQALTLGGDAQLELLNQFNPFEGVLFSVMPPRKAWRQISNLSGGEKTLSSLSLIFALHQFRQNPIYFMDEIDAALDFRNVSIIANFIKEKTSRVQFVVISLRGNTFELAGRLVGVFKQHNASQCVVCDPEVIAGLARRAGQGAEGAEGGEGGEAAEGSGPPGPSGEGPAGL